MTAAREQLPARRDSAIVEFEFRGIHFVAGISQYPDGRLAEVFLDSNKSGDTMRAISRDAAVLASLALQHGCPVATIRDALTADENGNGDGPMGHLFDLLHGAGWL